MVAFSCNGRGICASCAGRRTANVAAHLVDEPNLVGLRVLPDVPVRQYVLSFRTSSAHSRPFALAVRTAIGRMFVQPIFASHRVTARGLGVDASECSAVTFVQRFGGGLNLNVHLHVVVLDGV